MSEARAGLVIATHGRHYLVRGADGRTLACSTRGRRGGAACGDRVLYQELNAQQGVIDEILERTTLMYRSDAVRRKMLAANITQVAIITATEPTFSEELLGRALVASEALGVRPLIILNKTDLTERLSTARTRLAPYRALGYLCLEVSVRADVEAARAQLLPHLAAQTTLLLGQSGMGKSSLLNLLVPEADAATREYSRALGTGRHTTTDARLYELAESDGQLVDTPGFHEFGLAHLTPGEIERAFPDLRAYLGHCRFTNCTHLAEPGCAVRGAVAEGAIGAQRYSLFERLTRASTAP